MAWIILTHEQADFDALASLLGAHLLDEKSLPVLPHRLNRNLRAFLTIYGADLPFVEQRDLPAAPLEKVTLVDTQSLISLKGFSHATQVVVIDHHKPRPDLPEEWQVINAACGANTTIFVEQLRAEHFRLTVIQATLLLMGIYEDTGSLTYTRTTSRDLLAAAYLLEQGADLRIAARFLNHPLSLQQEVLFDQLRRSAQTHLIHGSTILISTADARGVDEELSTIAHKLRNLLDPDGLFLLFITSGGIQLIARSTSDQVDVAKIAAHFGGGGHERAAAALIRKGNLDEAVEALNTVLPQLVRPPVTVAQIMSRGARTLRADTTAAAAHEQMTRYGYEGYPVTRDGKIIGLLTRRAVDRAIGHKLLNAQVHSIMQAGSVGIHPEDTINDLQRVMTDSGWGQVPVVDPDTGEILGIVTRTDLLKIIANPEQTSQRVDLSERLERALPAARLALLKAVATIAFENGSAIYIVGGFVRDLLLDRPSLDFDLVVEGDAIELGKALRNAFGGRLTSHGRFGTAKWQIKDVHAELSNKLTANEQTPVPQVAKELPDFLDLISARTEFYAQPTALPTIERSSIKLDLHRRDFTINTLALRLDGSHYGELYDYYGGLTDLRQKLVRVLHSISFVDDPTRMLRAVRYEQRYGFTIETRTLQLLNDALPLLHRVSGERIRNELNHILAEPNCVVMIDRLAELGFLENIHPELTWDEFVRGLFLRMQNVTPEQAWQAGRGLGNQDLAEARAYIFWCLRLSQDSIKALLRRLMLPHGVEERALAASRLWHRIDELKGKTPSQICKILDDLPELAIYTVAAASNDPEITAILNRYVTQWRATKPTVDGHQLLKMGLKPGPVYKQIIEELRAAWLDGKIRSVEGEQALLAELIEKTESTKV